MRLPAPIANGLRTDHPVPGLPFVDDSLLPLTDPHRIEKIGRGRGEGMWGREDLYTQVPDAWRAFTTDPTNTNLAWLVIHHPDNGTTVLLYRDKDAVSAFSYQDFENEGIIPLVVRAGGYWSDGNVWVRPTQTVDPVTRARKWDMPSGTRTVTADEALAITDGVPTSGQVHALDEFSRSEVPVEPYPTWVARSLSVWADSRGGDSIPLNRSIIDVEAPELDHKHLSDNTQAAGLAGVEPSTWRAYVSRGTAPSPQKGWLGEGRPYWSLPVLQAWIARRDRDEQGRALVSDVDEYARPAVDQISEAIAHLGRKAFKSEEADNAVRFALERTVIGLTTHDYIPAEMHASWLVDQFNPGHNGTLSDHAGDQITSLMWLNPNSAERALRSYVSKGVKRGYEREALEHSLTQITQVRDHPVYAEYVERAISPQWGE